MHLFVLIKVFHKSHILENCESAALCAPDVSFYVYFSQMWQTYYHNDIRLPKKTHCVKWLNEIIFLIRPNFSVISQIKGLWSYSFQDHHNNGAFVSFLGFFITSSFTVFCQNCQLSVQGNFPMGFMVHIHCPDRKTETANCFPSPLFSLYAAVVLWWNHFALWLQEKSVPELKQPIVKNILDTLLNISKTIHYIISSNTRRWAKTLWLLTVITFCCCVRELKVYVILRSDLSLFELPFNNSYWP